MLFRSRYRAKSAATTKNDNKLCNFCQVYKDSHGFLKEKFLNVDLYESEATTFKVKNDTEIYPPFNSIDGLGDTVAKNIVAEREKREFISIEEVQSRAKVSQTLMDKMKEMGIFDVMDESSQLSLF